MALAIHSHSLFPNSSPRGGHSECPNSGRDLGHEATPRHVIYRFSASSQNTVWSDSAYRPKAMFYPASS